MRCLLFFAEAAGFEPPEPRSSPVFKTGVIDHSTIFPYPTGRDIAQIGLQNYCFFLN